MGIDTPETKHPSKPVQCFGAQAPAMTAELVPVGAAVALELDVSERDRYGRTLAYLWPERWPVGDLRSLVPVRTSTGGRSGSRGDAACSPRSAGYAARSGARTPN